MTNTAEVPYGLVKDLPQASFDAVKAEVTAALADEGFGILTEIKVHEALRNKLGIPFRRYLILGACNPSLAHQMIEKEPQLGLLLPCNVVIQERQGGGVTVSVADPRALFSLTGEGADTSAAEEVRTRVARVLETVQGTAPQPGSEQRPSLINELRQLGDRVRLKAHLGGMEVKERWKRLEPRLRELEQRTETATDGWLSELSQVGKGLKQELEALVSRLSAEEDDAKDGKHDRSS